MNIRLLHLVVALSSLFGQASNSLADTAHPYSTNAYGALGLNTVPNARFDPIGTVRGQISTLDPYAHASLGFQLANPLYINLRQTAEFSSFSDKSDDLFPGVDAKLRLLSENTYRPAIALGLQSAIGDTRTAGEYLTLSKRYHNFDFTAGLGWGRFAAAGTFDNPLGALFSHFDDERTTDGSDRNSSDDWFTGEEVGILAGIEYFTPIKGLSLKADYGGDSFEAEEAAFDFNAPSPWSFGLNYKPRDFVDIGVATQGNDKIMGRISLQSSVKKWPHRTRKNGSKFRSFKPDITPQTTNGHTAALELPLSTHHSAPHQIGKAALKIANTASPEIKGIAIMPTYYGLRGPSILLIRRDIESAANNKQGSAEEIWHSTEITNDFKWRRKDDPAIKKRRLPRLQDINLILENQVSLAEQDEGALFRSSLIAEIKDIPLHKAFRGGFGLRLNIADDLDGLSDLRPRAIIPIRSNVDEFADRVLAVDTAYIASTHNLRPNLYAATMGGYLEEMFAGGGGEILYRPYDKRFALGADGFLVLKRNPETFLNYRLINGMEFSGHLNAWYDIPEADVTLGLKAGRFLAGDYGGTLSLRKNFKNGATLEGYTTISSASDFDLFGGESSADHGIRLSLPLGGFKYTPQSSVKLIASPLGRDIGQFIRNPIPLYDLTQNFSKAHLIDHWDEVTD